LHRTLPLRPIPRRSAVIVYFAAQPGQVSFIARSDVAGRPTVGREKNFKPCPLPRRPIRG
jgi:hypothetical protein